jgi:hypothetical protein
MAVLAERLVVTINTVVRCLLGQYPMFGIPEAEMGRGHTRSLMALIALLDRKLLVILVGLDGCHKQTCTHQKDG